MMSPMITKAHRWLGLGLALFWTIQILTGVAIVFRWELDDAAVAGERVAVDTNALAGRIEAITQQHGTVSSMWASSARSDRFDIYYADAGGAEHALRVDGKGRELRDRVGESTVAQGAIYDTLTTIHQSLFAGATGVWVIGIHGTLLLVSLALGLRMAWPRAKFWKRTLFFRPRGPARIRVRGWHRVLGLWGALPALLLVGAGVMLVFIDDLRSLFDANIDAPVAVAGPTSVGPAQAFSIALARYPGGVLSALQMPTAERPLYRVRIRATDEFARNWGTTSVYVNAADGSVVDQRAASLVTARGILDSVYPLHTGQISGTAGRVLALLIGVWLMAMIALGIASWMGQRHPVVRG